MADAPTPTKPAGPAPSPRRSIFRRLLRLAFLAACCYLGVILVLLFLENWLLFRPTRASEDWIPPPNERFTDVELISADGTRLHAWWCPPEGWEPVHGATLYCHGNAGNLSHRGESILRWQRPPLRQAVLIFDYPGYGKSEGKPTEAGCYAAADAAYDWLVREKQVPPERLLLYGGSLGGAVATDLAVRRPHRALVLVSAFTSIPEMAQEVYPWLPARWLVRNQFDNLAKIGQCTQPVFIAHGTADSLVPFAHAERLFAAANEPKHLFRMEGYEHYHTPDPEFYLTLADFLEKCERAK
ncbi:MAG TPA: alpha/beta hydrolase [Gemmataceae bacterium]|nr:alpha/beta hydrolase [Gemmataceae bacterium]